MARTDDRKRAEGDGRGSPAQGRELRARGRATMRSLLDAGLEVFTRRGYHAARVDDIVKVARTSHGTFYLYFANKEELFAALADEVAADLGALADQLGPVGPDADGYHELRSWLEVVVGGYERAGAIIRAWTEATEAEADPGAGAHPGAAVLGGLARALATRIEAGSGDPGFDAETGALALVAMIERLDWYSRAGLLDVDRDRMLDTVAQVAHAGIFGGRYIPDTSVRHAPRAAGARRAEHATGSRRAERATGARRGAS